MFEIVEKVTVCEPALMLPSLKKKNSATLYFFTKRRCLCLVQI